MSPKPYSLITRDRCPIKSFTSHACKVLGLYLERPQAKVGRLKLLLVGASDTAI
jgi:hypothetical protein